MLPAVALAGGLLFLAAPSYGDPIAPLQPCGDQANPCTDPSFDPTSAGGPSPAGMFGLFLVLALVVGGGTFFWRVSAARRIAQQAGLDPDAAVTTTMLSRDGLAATYLAASLHRPADDEDRSVAHPPPLSTRTAEDRLGELKRLHDQSLITDDEYAHRRTAIVDSV
jgi:hypothetical protein